MINILKSDFFRISKSKLMYVIVLIIALLSLGFIMLIRQDIRLGISVFGNITAFKGIKDVIRFGIEYQKSLGLLSAILISVFIGQEYQWQTWQQKWLTGKSRTLIYISKMLLSTVSSVAIFVLFQSIIFVFSGQYITIFTYEYIYLMLCGIFIYAALGSVLCLLSILIKNSISSMIVSILYILFCESVVSLIRNLSSYLEFVKISVEWCIRHSIWGMASYILNISPSMSTVLSIGINALGSIILSTVLGIWMFRKYEL